MGMRLLVCILMNIFLRSGTTLSIRNTQIDKMGSVFGKIGEERPEYTVRSVVEGEYEIREYKPNIAIETTRSFDNPKEVDSGPFMKLAGYIGVRNTPRNNRQEPISMTAPVVCVKSLDGKTEVDKMQFILPSKLEDPPVPCEGTDVSIVKRSEKIMAVRNVSGRTNDQIFEKERDILLENLSRDGIEILEPMCWETYRYNPPWTIPSMRTSEVAIQLAK